MKKYNKPAIQVVELTVKESISALPTGFQGAFNMKKLAGAQRFNVSMYTKGSQPTL